MKIDYTITRHFFRKKDFIENEAIACLVSCILIIPFGLSMIFFIKNMAINIMGLILAFLGILGSCASIFDGILKLSSKQQDFETLSKKKTTFIFWEENNKIHIGIKKANKIVKAIRSFDSLKDAQEYVNNRVESRQGKKNIHREEPKVLGTTKL